MKQFDSIVLAPEEVTALNKLNNDRESVAAFVQQVVTAGERRNSDLLEKGQEIWGQLAKKYDLDLSTVAYAVKDGKLVPVQVKL